MGRFLVCPVRAYDAKDDELIERLRAPFLQSWRMVTTHVLADTFDAAGITVTPAAHPWGIATLSAANLNCEPLLCEVEDDDGRAAAAVYGGLQLLDFDSTINGYATCVARLLPEAGRSSVGQASQRLRWQSCTSLTPTRDPC